MIVGMTETRVKKDFFSFGMSIYFNHLPVDLALFCNSVSVDRFGRTVR
jgi:hypothetical protein